MRKLSVLFLSIFLASNSFAGTFSLFAPATGVLKGTSSSYVTSPAASADIVSMFSTCTGTKYLGADGACHDTATSSNPAALVGLTAVNGSAATFLRSDGAPALDLSIAPTWTNLHTFSDAIKVGTIPIGPVTQAAGTIRGQLIQLYNQAQNPAVTLHKFNGTPSAPTPPLNGDILGAFAGGGYNGTGFSSNTQLIAYATENWNSGALGSKWTFNVVQTGTTNIVGIFDSDAFNTSFGNTSTNPSYSFLGSGTVSATAFSGSGAALTALNAGNISTGTLPVTRGGSGAVTLTGPLKGNGTSAFSSAVAADIVGLFSACSGTQYLGADGACHSVSGATSFGDGWDWTTSSTQLLFTSPLSMNTYLGIVDDAMAGVTDYDVTISGDVLFSAGTFKINLGAGAQNVCLQDGTDCPSGTTFANPSASIGLSAVNGSASTAMRSDAAPALSQSIVPSWTGIHTFTSASAGARIVLQDSAATGTDRQNTILAVSAGGAFSLDSATNAAPTTAVQHMIQATRNTSTGGFQALNLGNVADNPSFSFLGTGSLTSNGVVLSSGGATAGSPTGGAKGAGTLNAEGLFVNGVAVATGLSQSTGSFTLTLSTGCTTTPSGTALWTKTGNIVSMRIPGLTCTSNSTSLSLTSLPSAIRPVSTSAISPVVGTDNGAFTVSYGSVDTAGVLSLFNGANPGGGGNWTNSGTKSFNGATLTWTLD